MYQKANILHLSQVNFSFIISIDIFFNSYWQTYASLPNPASPCVTKCSDYRILPSKKLDNMTTEFKIKVINLPLQKFVINIKI